MRRIVSRLILNNMTSQRTKGIVVLYLVIVQIFSVHVLSVTCHDAKKDNDRSSKGAAEQTGKSAFEMYKGLLRHKRASQLEAVQSIMKLDKHEKQYKMVNVVLDKIFVLMLGSKVKLMEAGFTPGDMMPDDEKYREAFANTVENTMFLSDILLRMPDITHDILKKNKDWDISLKWALGFVEETGVLSEIDRKLLHLVAQELNIIEREENYINPFSKSSQQTAEVETEVDKLLNEKIKELEKKRKRKEKRKKGPTLSRSHSEL